MEHRDLKSDLKNLYEGIDADEFATEQSRKRLAIALGSSTQSQVRPVEEAARSVRTPWFSFPLLMQVSFACLVVVAVGFTGWRQYQLSSFEAVELASLQAFVERNGDHTQLYRQAKDMESSSEPLRKLNGLYILSALGQDDENILASAQGLLEDPRAEFRAYYLDYLITYADEAYYDIEYLEALIDRETDPECIELLYELLKIAERRQRSFATGA
ncbi:MAG: hypothetical protein Q8L60_14580 [Gammaproteobacteria bacterium]|nr:hypothetical protein [Gammaproteobacteria bacterium]MDP2346598.1 hypothetical protein [Gammaproteobacteria bacterium]